MWIISVHMPSKLLFAIDHYLAVLLVDITALRQARVGISGVYMPSKLLLAVDHDFAILFIDIAA